MYNNVYGDHAPYMVARHIYETIEYKTTKVAKRVSYTFINRF